jgi:cyclopropane-fatty-acyl-phospholipid synthase
MEKLLAAVLSRLVQRGSLTVVSAGGREYTFGDGTGEEVRVRFLDKAAERAVVLNPELRLGELFMDGRFVVERGTIYDFLSAVLRSSTTAADRSVIGKLVSKFRFITRSAISRNNPWRSRRNVAHHYDLDGRLYRLFLDPDQQYSCAYFERPDSTLEEAQLAKKRLITAKLFLEPDSRVLDIGCGWGGLGLYIKQIGGARQVQGITLSTEQLEVARARAEAAGLADSVRFMLQDYRATEGAFDRIVSVGMFEHVGPRFYPTYFNKVRRLLKPDGAMLLHTIGHLDGPWYPNPWLDKYIFPGGQLPALSEMLPAIERAGLLVTDIECLRMHYAETLAAWRRRFMARRAEAEALYDERFCRMWEFYLASCETAFRFQNVAVFQVQLARSADALPITREYLAERMQDLRMRETEVYGGVNTASEPVPLRKHRH